MENLAFVHGTSRILSLTKVVISNAMPCIEASFYRLLYKNRFLLFLQHNILYLCKKRRCIMNAIEILAQQQADEILRLLSHKRYICPISAIPSNHTFHQDEVLYERNAQQLKVRICSPLLNTQSVSPKQQSRATKCMHRQMEQLASCRELIPYLIINRPTKCCIWRPVLYLWSEIIIERR